MNNNFNYNFFKNSKIIIKNLANNDFTAHEKLEDTLVTTEPPCYQSTTKNYNTSGALNQKVNYSHSLPQYNNEQLVYPLQNSTVTKEEQKEHQPSLPQINRDAAVLFNYLKNELFTPGYLSAADHFFEDKFKSVSNEYLISLLNKVAMLCYADLKKHSYFHFLNLIKNASFYMSYDDLKIYAVLSLAKDDSIIQDLAISIFEGFDYTSTESLQDAINSLNNSVISLYPWINEYKYEVIRDLKEKIKG
ncbi:hypothetical protein KNR18_08550 [Klebsiella sp. O852]|uniref:hypothetical protein n=1 Tax=Klebsiella sp. O852 TaxID=2718650 RepID=UPI001C023D19|nr:hypothetical protein [Klebsiella sp. O852]MBT9335062.1 hypothetical protein [Klebsiella sp. O852]